MKVSEDIKFKAAELSVKFIVVGTVTLIAAGAAKALLRVDYVDCLTWVILGGIYGSICGVYQGLGRNKDCSTGFAILIFISGVVKHDGIIVAAGLTLLAVLAAAATAVWVQSRTLIKYAEQNQTRNLRPRRRKNRRHKKTRNDY